MARRSRPPCATPTRRSSRRRWAPSASCHPGGVQVTVRPASRADDAALLAIDVATWSPDTSPGPPPASRGAFFCLGLEPGDVLVAEAEGDVAGYAALGPATRLQSNSHVLE